jgi:hypothetical protein
MKKLTKININEVTHGENSCWSRVIHDFNPKVESKQFYIDQFIQNVVSYDKYLYYPLIGELLNDFGIKVNVTRDGDTNNRSDAMIIDEKYSISVEIKSPTEIEYVNIKSIRQALENKIILLSRKFFPTTPLCSTLAIGYKYPEKRSEVYELIENYYSTYKIKVGIIDLADLLDIHWQIKFEGASFDVSKIRNLKGKF